jgi:hypothetical protein
MPIFAKFRVGDTRYTDSWPTPRKARAGATSADRTGPMKQLQKILRNGTSSTVPRFPSAEHSSMNLLSSHGLTERVWRALCRPTLAARPAGRRLSA